MTRRKRADGWWYPWIFVGGMLLVVLVNGIMIFIALDSWTGLETESHYRKGLAYNQNLAAAAAQARLGWRLDLTWERAGASGTTPDIAFMAKFSDRQGAPLAGLDVIALMVRPTHRGYDFELPMIAAGNGYYTARTRLPLAGQWSVRIHAFRGEAAFQEVRRLHLE